MRTSIRLQQLTGQNEPTFGSIGDRFALISGVLPAAVALVQLSLADPGAAVSAGQRVAALCRELAEDEWGDRELWRTAAELIEFSSVASTTARRIVARVQMIVGDDERTITLRVLNYLLATWHASPDEVIGYQLSVIEVLLGWFPAGESVRRRLMTPYVESYWRHTVRDRRFAFRVPNLTAAAIEAASGSPEADRIRAVLSATVNGFRIRGANEVLQRLR